MPNLYCNDNKDNRAFELVYEYISRRFFKGAVSSNFKMFIVWKAKILQNWKYLISTTLEDNMYYELTFNGDKDTWYLDVYSKEENIVIAE